MGASLPPGVMISEPEQLLGAMAGLMVVISCSVLMSIVPVVTGCCGDTWDLGHNLWPNW